MPENQTTSIREELLGQRTVVLFGKINTASIDTLVGNLLTLQIKSSDPIKLIINSEGGVMDAALTLCDVISHILTAPVHGIAIGECSSAATFVMLHCAKRLSTPHSRFLIHSGTMQGVSIQMNHTTSEAVQQLLTETQQAERRIVGLYKSRLTPTSWKGKIDEKEKDEFVKRLILRGDGYNNKAMSAEEALEAGLIEEIVTEKLGIF